MSNVLPLDFVLSFCKDMIPEHGEDNYCYSFREDAALLGVFDGCGGSGARKHKGFSDHTEAYMASRICAGAFYDLFQACNPGAYPARQLLEEVFTPGLKSRLLAREAQMDRDGPQIRGSMVRTLPTTAAVALIQQGGDGIVLVNAIWAGDSRVYILDDTGLAQITADDTSVPDPMENLYEDGLLRNVVCSDRKFQLHCKTVCLRPPFMVLAATDGCFGYLSTPMEFEGLLLQSLQRADSVDRWEQDMAQGLHGVAGDDHTLCLAAFGYSDFRSLKAAMRERTAYLEENYLRTVASLPIEDRESRVRLWNGYKNSYLRYLQEERA